MTSCMWCLFAAIAAVMPAGGVDAAEPTASPDSIFAAPLAAENLDPAAFAQWLDGAEKPFELRDGPRHVIWTRNTHPEWDGVRYGEGKEIGVRHLRIGWKNAIAIGTVVARGGGQVSVLATDAAYPGDMGDEALWVPAQRVKNAKVCRNEAEPEDIAIWVLPPKTLTCAIRFSHSPEPTDRLFSGWLGSVALLSERFASVGSQAVTVAASSPEKAGRINDDSNNGTWSVWDNGPEGAETTMPDRLLTLRDSQVSVHKIIEGNARILDHVRLGVPRMDERLERRRRTPLHRTRLQ